ncbi:hypothetical protein [Legionella worsleiensis]|uniref:Uncharacterized protein n=1 Tax=Legionella worsleiensis TaxID=45076 RepID=A0A0W1A3U2_9GAMM|nr:hypothetical protein [Legionella worsleiensis]KTD75856.1 hypothetical protein Lwor_2422 [Legionella worsleiensis]STY32869.1 Uncharacterised protein [Legionella worsleiensis]
MNTKNTQRNTLLYVHISTHFKEIIRVARVMKNNGLYQPFIFFDAQYEGVEQHIALCEAEEIQYICYFDTNKIVKIKLWFRIVRRLFIILLRFLEIIKYLLFPLGYALKTLHDVYRKIFKKKSDGTRLNTNTHLPKLLLSGYALFWNHFPFLLPAISRLAHRYCRYLPGILKEYDIKLMVFPEHNLFYFTQLFVYLGKKQGVSSIIVPFTIANTMEWAEAFHKEKSRSLSNLYNKICAAAFPHWIHTYKQKQLLLPVELVLLHEMLHISPKNPWLLNSGDIDFLALESDAMKEYYVSAGIDEKYLRATGALYNDELYFKLQNSEENRTQLYKKLNLQQGKPLLLCALPPNQCDGRQDEIEFSDYEELVRFVMSELSKYADDYNVIINLHPRIRPEDVEYISDYPVTVFKGDIAEVIPLCAVYVATCSATIRMAVSCGIPVINYDLYRYRYDDYKEIEGVLTLFDREEFSTRLRQLIIEKEFYQHLQSAQIKDSNKWGTLDGKSGTNLLNEINMLFV